MNTRVWQIVIVATLLAVARAADSQTPSTNAPPTPVLSGDPVSTEKSTAVVTNSPAGSSNPAPSPVAASLSTNSPAPDATVDTSPPPVDPALTNAGPPTVVRPRDISLPPLLDQVVRMAERGTDESVLKAYIDSAPAYRITGNDIIQLQDLGISQSVILALVQRSKEVTAGTAPVEPAPSVAAPPPTDQSTEVATSVVEPPATPPTDYYDALAPYGSWYNVPGYGYCWQPTVVVINRSWRPYCDYGNWGWSDHGWYWNSYYSWGWAPFHYGRWFSHPHRGWLWHPDRVWGPAWVSWRHSGSHYGWAPLPPGAHFAAGHGWTYRGGRVGAHSDFGLGHHAYTFVHRDRFASRHVGRSAIAARDADSVFRGSTVANTHSIGADRRLINNSVPRTAVGGGAVGARRQVSMANPNSRGAQSASTLPSFNRAAPVGRSVLAARSGSMTRPAPAARSSVAPMSRSAAPAANAFAQRAAPVRPAMRQSSPVQVFPRQSVPRMSPQPMSRVAPSAAPRMGGGFPAARSAPAFQQAPRYSAPAAPRQFAPGGGRSFSPGMPSRGSIASPGSFSGSRGGGMHGGGGGRRR